MLGTVSLYSHPFVKDLKPALVAWDLVRSHRLGHADQIHHRIFGRRIDRGHFWQPGNRQYMKSRWLWFGALFGTGDLRFPT